MTLNLNDGLEKIKLFCKIESQSKVENFAVSTNISYECGKTTKSITPSWLGQCVCVNAELKVGGQCCRDLNEACVGAKLKVAEPPMVGCRAVAKDWGEGAHCGVRKW